MTKSEERIKTLEAAITKAGPPGMNIGLAVCEMARQISRLGDIYEFELGIENGYEPNLKNANSRIMNVKK